MRRAVAAVIAVGLVSGMLLGVFAWKVVYRPHVDPMPEDTVDALLVLGPLEPWRMTMAEELMRAGRARNLVLSTPNLPVDARYCERKHDWPAYCFPPEPSTTRGEAMALKRLAKAHGWSSFAVLTVDFHAARSRFIFKRCLGQDVPVVGRHVAYADSQRRHHVFYQFGGFVKEIALGRCAG